jgi:hypothetical protein
MRKNILLIALAFVLCSFSAVQAQESSMSLSSVFADGGSIPPVYTCDGTNVSPPLAWQGAPEGTKSFALIVGDPDAPSGVWVHWVAYNIPGELSRLSPPLPKNVLQGKNSFDKTVYGGPCPPKEGGPHRYFFRLYALDALLNLAPGADIATLKAAMRGHVLGGAELMGLYDR